MIWPPFFQGYLLTQLISTAEINRDFYDWPKSLQKIMFSAINFTFFRRFFPVLGALGGLGALSEFAQALAHTTATLIGQAPHPRWVSAWLTFGPIPN